MGKGQPFQANWELDITASNNVLNFKVRKFGREAQLLNHPGILAGRQLGRLLALCPSYDHLPRRKDERGGLWLTNSHDHRREALSKIDPEREIQKKEEKKKKKKEKKKKKGKKKKNSFSHRGQVRAERDLKLLMEHLKHLAKLQWRAGSRRGNGIEKELRKHRQPLPVLFQLCLIRRPCLEFKFNRCQIPN